MVFFTLDHDCKSISTFTTPTIQPLTLNPTSAGSTPGFERPTGARLKSRDENSIRWVDLLDKFKTVQEKARRAQRAASQRQLGQDGLRIGSLQNPSLTAALSAAATSDQARSKERNFGGDSPRGGAGPGGRSNTIDAGVQQQQKGGSGGGGSILGGAHRHKSSLPNLGRLGIGSRKSKR